MVRNGKKLEIIVENCFYFDGTASSNVPLAEQKIPGYCGIFMSCFNTETMFAIAALELGALTAAFRLQQLGAYGRRSSVESEMMTKCNKPGALTAALESGQVGTGRLRPPLERGNRWIASNDGDEAGASTAAKHQVFTGQSS